MRRSHEPLRIEIATLGRFHVLDLARELDALGHHVRFHSYVPKRRAMKFGLPAHCHVAMLPWLAPFVALDRLCGRTRFAAVAARLLEGVADALVSLRVQPCDVFIAMSGMYVRAPLRARRRFGAKLVVERGSVHIEAQKDILDNIKKVSPKAATVSAHAVSRELASYAFADCVVVPSRHAEVSFLERDVQPARLFRNPYGVDLSIFTSDSLAQRDGKMILFVGIWSYQKGVDVLARAMRTLCRGGFRLYHVGAVGDAPVPTERWFHAVGKLDQRELPMWYRRAHCLVLPSRQDGFGLVLLQALACGCPVVGSTMTGAVDLSEDVGLCENVHVVSVGSDTALVDAISRCPSRTATAPLSEDARAELGWRGYARRYEAMLEDLVAQAST